MLIVYIESYKRVFFFGSEQPIFTCKAHVFHIDPKTKRSWMSASSAAVSVSFFYDSSRNLYRIISVEGTKVILLFGLLTYSLVKGFSMDLGVRYMRPMCVELI